jgi:hypothetical protein
MNTAAEVLLIIVSSVLAIFLLVCTIAVIKFIQVLRSLRHIAEQAEKIADSAEAVGEFFRKSAGPIAFSKFVSNIAETVMHHKKGRE